MRESYTVGWVRNGEFPAHATQCTARSIDLDYPRSGLSSGRRGGPGRPRFASSITILFSDLLRFLYMASPVVSLHHVTATVDDAQDDLDFCVRALGLRLVKKTVNFDNHHVYHFYYGDRHGTPGTIWTTFPYQGRGVPVGHKGAGQVTVTSFSVP